MLDSQPLRTASASFHVWGARQRRRQEGSSFWSRRYDGATLREVRARNGVGRPPTRLLSGSTLGKTERPTPFITVYAPEGEPKTRLEAAVVHFGSQRAAAKALGMNLSTFQRRLKKEQCAA